MHDGCTAQLLRGVISVGFAAGTVGTARVTSRSGDRLIECVIWRRRPSRFVVRSRGSDAYFPHALFRLRVPAPSVADSDISVLGHSDSLV